MFDDGVGEFLDVGHTFRLLELLRKAKPLLKFRLKLFELFQQVVF